MKKLLILILTFLAAGTMAAQDTPKSTEKPDKDVVVKKAAIPNYKMAFSIYELQEGKKINQRDYSLLLEANDRGANTLKIGTKVPIDAANGGTTYADVGFELRCSAIETVNGKLAVGVDITITNFAVPEQNTDPRTAGSRPVLRGVTQRVGTVVTPGKPQILTSMDDVNSNKRMQVELTATKMD
jgi:hypothetical protein